MLGTEVEGQVPKPKATVTTLPDQIIARISDGHYGDCCSRSTSARREFRDVVYLKASRRKNLHPPFCPTHEARDCRFVPPRPFEKKIMSSREHGSGHARYSGLRKFSPRRPGPLQRAAADESATSAGSQRSQRRSHVPQTFTGRTDEAARRDVKTPPGVCHAVRIPCLYGKLGTGDGQPLFDTRIRTDIFTSTTSHTYKLVIWHPYVGGAKEQVITVPPKGQTTVEVKIPAPVGRLYVNEMVDHPYTRFAVTNEVQSQIVPTLIRQER